MTAQVVRMGKQTKKLDERREWRPSRGTLLKIAPQPCQRAVPSGSLRTLLALARLLARQAAIEATRLDRATTAGLVLGTTS